MSAVAAVVAALPTAAIACSISLAAVGGEESADEIYARLEKMSGEEIVRFIRRMIPVSPAYPTIELRIAMYMVARTRRLDAALLLIRSLALNEDPEQSRDGYIPPNQFEPEKLFTDLPPNERKMVMAHFLSPIFAMRMQATLIQAIRALRSHYGSQVLPLLFVEGISTDKKWMRERCALAVRIIGKKEEIRRLRAVFSLDTSENAGAKEFSRLLDEEKLEVWIFNRRREHARKRGGAIPGTRAIDKEQVSEGGR